MVTVEITNYESIEHLELSFDKFSTVIGKNFIGKSSIFRAINSALTNQQGTNFIRWGADFCEVRIKAEYIDLLWHKETGNNFYVINGEKKEKVGNEQPPDQIREAGLGLVQLSNQKINLFYCEQFSPLFLVDKKDSKSADLIASVYGLDKLYKAADLCNKDQKEIRGLLNLRKKDLLTAERDLKKYQAIEDVSKEKKYIFQQSKFLGEEQTAIDKIKILFDCLLSSSTACKRLQPVQKVDIPALESLKKSYREFRDLESLSKAHSSLYSECYKLEKIKEVVIPTSKDTEPLIEELKILKLYQKEFQKTSKEQDRLKAVSALALPELDFEVDTLEHLKKEANNLFQAKKDLMSMKSELEALRIEKENIDKEKQAFEICPLCKKSL